MKLFLFDFDGVLVESLHLYEKAVSLSLARMNQPLIRGQEEFLELFEGNFYESLAKKGVNLDKFMEVSGDLLAQVDYKEMQPITPMTCKCATPFHIIPQPAPSKVSAFFFCSSLKTR